MFRYHAYQWMVYVTPPLKSHHVISPSQVIPDSSLLEGKDIFIVSHEMRGRRDGKHTQKWKQNMRERWHGVGQLLMLRPKRDLMHHRNSIIAGSRWFSGKDIRMMKCHTNRKRKFAHIHSSFSVEVSWRWTSIGCKRSYLKTVIEMQYLLHELIFLFDMSLCFLFLPPQQPKLVWWWWREEYTLNPKHHHDLENCWEGRPKCVLEGYPDFFRFPSFCGTNCIHGVLLFVRYFSIFFSVTTRGQEERYSLVSIRETSCREWKWTEDEEHVFVAVTELFQWNCNQATD